MKLTIDQWIGLLLLGISIFLVIIDHATGLPLLFG